MKRAMASALAYLIFFEPVVRAAPNFRLAEEKLKKFNLGDLDIHRKLNVPGDKSLRIEGSFIGTKSSGIGGGRGQPNIINIGGGFPSDGLPDWRKQPKIYNKGYNLGKSVLDALYEGKDPTIACNARLKAVDPKRFERLEWELGKSLPTVAPSQLPLASLGLTAVKAPVMRDVGQCSNTHKNACQELLQKSLNNPKQMALHSKCDSRTVSKFDKLVEKYGKEVDVSDKIEYLEPYIQDNIEEYNDLVIDSEGKFHSYETCDNQLEMTRDLIDALDGNPSAKLADVDSDKLLSMLKEVNPSAHEAVSCLSNQDGNQPIDLKGHKEPTGSITGSLTGIVYREDHKKEGGIFAAGAAFCAANATACLAAGTAIATALIGGATHIWGVYVNRNEARADREMRDQQFRFSNGLDSIYGNKKDLNKASDNKTSDNKTSDNKTSDNKTSDNKTSDNKTSDKKANNPTDTKDTTVITFDHPDYSKPSDDTAVNLRQPKINPADPGYDPQNDRPINNNPNNLHFAKGTTKKVCESVYSDYSNSKFKDINIGISAVGLKNATFNKEYYRSIGLESAPDDFKSNSFKSKKSFNNKSACKKIRTTRG
ncbi:hypothetical protein [Pseudobacteriovorax antillogorgiicola]|uniref:Uncharacterized protein n=1 Tax=Pseudobacteriovorax antillogorgiicola TaxID=1513793 RepID=A0A1Y6CPB5_9BACT|nr:hypothetical protein [Pseudobacteriovorax antillogorgiicola]TCS44247.1 hypothetical protein EDD56_13447 [Pseudobacteriovorax antillogorgiicola]SMF80724.1 hypothetical protein SAMN06296036_13548 [Pseudobacteriovorax antillogorgiicola]